MTVNICSGENNLPSDPETNELFKRVLELCSSDSLHLYEIVDSSLKKSSIRKFAAGMREIKNENDAKYAKVNFSFRDVPDNEVYKRPLRRTSKGTIEVNPEFFREEYREQLRKAVAALEFITPEARRERYEERAAAASLENKTKGLKKLVGGTEKQKAYAELLRATKIPKMPKGEEIIARVKNAVDIIELATAFNKSQIERILKKYDL